MSGGVPTDQYDLSRALRIEDVCKRFESAWKGRHRPSIEDYVADVPEPQRAELLRELIGLDVSFRRCRLLASRMVSIADLRQRAGVQALACPVGTETG